MTICAIISFCRSAMKLCQLQRFSHCLSPLSHYCTGSDDRHKSAAGIRPEIPPYEEKFCEPIKLKKARLLYQSRKRGMLENGLLLSTFAAKYLEEMDKHQLQMYDRLINLPSNDWDIFYWATGVRPTPEEFDNDVMKMLKEHVRNKNRENRLRQPDL